MLEILPLRERPISISQLAQWHYAQWSDLNPTSTVEYRIERMRAQLESQSIPQTFIALDGETLLGSASLVAADLPGHEELTPWLATVYVDPPHRNRGIGEALVKRVAAEARMLGYSEMYLFTPDRASFYARIGWDTVDQEDYNGIRVSVMRLRLAS